MNDNSNKSVLRTVVTLVVGAIIVLQGVRELSRGAPAEEWLGNVTLGVLFLLVYFGPRLVARIAGNRLSTERGDPSDWATLAVFGLWVVVSLGLLFAGISTVAVKGFVVFGVIGVGAMAYRLSRVSEGVGPSPDQ
ncbi:MAG: hypothetical protein ABEJ42_02550 [Halobacteriaceae archaeon]